MKLTTSVLDFESTFFPTVLVKTDDETVHGEDRPEEFVRDLSMWRVGIGWFRIVRELQESSEFGRPEYENEDVSSIGSSISAAEIYEPEKEERHSRRSESMIDVVEQNLDVLNLLLELFFVLFLFLRTLDYSLGMSLRDRSVSLLFLVRRARCFHDLLQLLLSLPQGLLQLIPDQVQILFVDTRFVFVNSLDFLQRLDRTQEIDQVNRTDLEVRIVLRDTIGRRSVSGSTKRREGKGKGKG